MTHGTNGTAQPRITARPAKAPTAKPKARKAPQTTAKAERHGAKWAYAGVGITLGASAVLNGLAFAEHATSPVLAWGLGITIPGLVLVFSRVAALAWGRGDKLVACPAALATLALLALSVQHLALSISRITGEHWSLAACMAVAIDVGLVACELFTLRR